MANKKTSPMWLAMNELGELLLYSYHDEERAFAMDVNAQKVMVTMDANYFIGTWQSPEKFQCSWEHAEEYELEEDDVPVCTACALKAEVSAENKIFCGNCNKPYISVMGNDEANIFLGL